MTFSDRNKTDDLMGSANNICFQVIEGVDKGRRFTNLDLPITIGREDGNVIRLSDDRVSRFHVKIQEDQGQLVLMDLDSTNGTRVNGETVQLRLLRPGDRIAVGRSTLLFGTGDQIRSLIHPVQEDSESDATVGQAPPPDDEEVAVDPDPFDFGIDGSVDVFTPHPPSLPSRLSPAQAARMAEVLEFLHRCLAEGTAEVQIPMQSTEARLPLSSWQQVQGVLTLLARYCRQVSDPEANES
jgi:pSer/pThr/pTyr-binding forkhead associated (FHA) protein